MVIKPGAGVWSGWHGHQARRWRVVRLAWSSSPTLACGQAGMVIKPDAGVKVIRPGMVRPDAGVKVIRLAWSGPTLACGHQARHGQARRWQTFTGWHGQARRWREGHQARHGQARRWREGHQARHGQARRWREGHQAWHGQARRWRVVRLAWSSSPALACGQAGMVIKPGAGVWSGWHGHQARRWRVVRLAWSSSPTLACGQAGMVIKPDAGDLHPLAWSGPTLATFTRWHGQARRWRPSPAGMVRPDAGRPSPLRLSADRSPKARCLPTFPP
jgi:hypothetical protein